MVGIIIVDVILFILFMAAGSMADCIGIAFAAWFFIAGIATLCIADAIESNTPAGRERWRRENEREEKEWLEWRYTAEEKKQQEKKAARKNASHKK